MENLVGMTQGGVAFTDAAKFSLPQKTAFDLIYRKPGLEACPNISLLVGGAGFGGKSHFMRCSAIHHALWLYAQWLKGKDDPLSSYRSTGLTLLFATSSLESLRDLHIKRFNSEFGHLGKYRPSHGEYGKCFVFKNEDMPTIVFRNMNDAGDRRGDEHAGGFLDEITQVTSAVYGDTTYTIRDSRVPCHPIVNATNPDGVGHSWVKAQWRPHKPFEERYQPYPATDPNAESLDPHDYYYIPFLPTDNPKYNEKTFLRNISNLAPHVQKARRFGLWDAPEGARWATFNPDIHTFDFAKTFPKGIPQHADILLHVDYGLRAPYCALWTLEDPATGDLYTYREDYKPGFNGYAQAQRIRMKTKNEKVKFAYADPAMWADLPKHMDRMDDKSIIEMYHEVLGDLPNFPSQFEKGYNRSRVQAMATLDRALDREDKDFPNWYISTECTSLISELSNAVYPKGSIKADSSEDIDPACPDHAITAAYYGIHTHFTRVIEPKRIPSMEESYTQAREVVLNKERRNTISTLAKQLNRKNRIKL
jgi:hypothetical protein